MLLPFLLQRDGPVLSSGVCWHTRLGRSVGCSQAPSRAAKGVHSTLLSARPWKRGGKSGEAEASSPSRVPASSLPRGFTVGFPILE